MTSEKDDIDVQNTCVANELNYIVNALENKD